jgi:hypothetical protein
MNACFFKINYGDNNPHNVSPIQNFMQGTKLHLLLSYIQLHLPIPMPKYNALKMYGGKKNGEALCILNFNTQHM